MRPLALALGFALATVPLTRASAQQKSGSTIPQGFSGLTPGMRVRVTSPSMITPLVANYLETRGDTLVFSEERAGRGVWSLTEDEITKLEVTAGEQTNDHHKVLVFGALGAAIGTVPFGFFAANAHPGNKSKDYSVLKSMAVGAAVGGLIGGIYGYRRKVEKWHNIPLPKKVSLVPDGSGHWRLSASLTF